MLVYVLEQVEVDHCVSCGGIWLDGGELELLMGTAAEKETWLKSFPLASAGREEKIKCPICSKKMQKVLYGDKIFLDRCPKNDGLWFDQGELEEMLRSEEAQSRHKAISLLGNIFREKPIQGRK